MRRLASTNGWVARVSRGTGETAAVTINYGTFINAILDFLIIAFAIFLVVKAMNAAMTATKKNEAAAPPPGPTREEVLLTEIRDALRNR